MQHLFFSGRIRSSMVWVMYLVIYCGNVKVTRAANDSALAACHLLPSPDTPCECVNDSERMMVCRNDSNITLLDLSNFGLRQVPAFEGVFDSLVILNLSANSIDFLALEVFNDELFPSLKALDLSGNELTDLHFVAGLKLSHLYVADNPLECKKLDALLYLLCSTGVGEDSLVVDKNASCSSSTNRVNLTLSLFDYCIVSGHGEETTEEGDGGGGGVNVALVVGSIAGGLFLCLFLVTVGVIVIYVLLRKCWSGKYFMHRAGVLRAKQQSYLQPADLCKSCHASSHLPAPPTSAAPIPPPLDLMSPQGEDKEQTVLYDSPLTATSLLSKSSLEDYRAGYILTLDSVPERKVSGSFKGSPSILPADYEVACPKSSLCDVTPPAGGVDSCNSDPTPYCTTTMIQPSSSTSLDAAAEVYAEVTMPPPPPLPPSRKLSEKKPPILPRKGKPAAEDVCSSSEAQKLREEVEYLKVIL